MTIYKDFPGGRIITLEKEQAMESTPLKTARIGYASDWTGCATEKIEIIKETTDGFYVCRGAPRRLRRLDGSTWLAYDNTGLFLRRKEEFGPVKEEQL